MERRVLRAQTRCPKSSSSQARFDPTYGVDAVAGHTVTLAHQLRRALSGLFTPPQTAIAFSRADRTFGWVNAALMLLVVACALYPFLYVLAVSVSSGAAVTAGRVVLWPVDVTLAAYGQVLSDGKFWLAYANTFFYAIAGTAMSLALIVPGAYALSKPRLKGRRVFNFLVAFTLWFHAGLIPFFLNVRDLGLLDSRFGIVIAFACSAFNVILLRNAFEQVAAPYEEAARLDGADDFQLLRYVYIPLAQPTIVTVALLCLVARWNGYFWAMVLLFDERKVPLQVYLKKIIVDLRADDAMAARLANAPYSFETITAAVIVASLVPILLLYPRLLRTATKGMTMGGVKE
jgi:putative aldouronate transport system permease protein